MKPAASHRQAIIPAVFTCVAGAGAGRGGGTCGTLQVRGAGEGQVGPRLAAVYMSLYTNRSAADSVADTTTRN